MHRRLVCLAVALLVSGCSFAGLGPPPNYGYVVITAGGVGLRSGSSDVPPNLDLKLHATGAVLQTIVGQLAIVTAITRAALIVVR